MRQHLTCKCIFIILTLFSTSLISAFAGVINLSFGDEVCSMSMEMDDMQVTIDVASSNNHSQPKHQLPPVSMECCDESDYSACCSDDCQCSGFTAPVFYLATFITQHHTLNTDNSSFTYQDVVSSPFLKLRKRPPIHTHA